MEHGTDRRLALSGEDTLGPFPINAGNEQYLAAHHLSAIELKEYFKEVDRLGRASGTSCCDFCCIKTS